MVKGRDRGAGRESNFTHTGVCDEQYYQQLDVWKQVLVGLRSNWTPLMMQWNVSIVPPPGTQKNGCYREMACILG